MNFKVIASSNFDRDTVDDILVCDSIETEKDANLIASTFNAVHGGSDAHYYYRVVPHDYKLKVWEP